MDAVKIFKALWHRKAFIVYMCILGAVITLCLKTFVFKDSYTYVMNYYITNSELAKLIVDVSSIETDVQMAESCKIILKSELAVDTVGEMLLEKYGEEYLSQYFDIVHGEDGVGIPYEELNDCIEIKSVQEGTAVLEVSVKNDNPYLARDIGLFLTYVAPNIVYYYVGADYISPYENAKLLVNDGLPSKKVFVLAGAATAFVLAVGFVMLNYRFSQRMIINAGDIKRIIQLNILGNIPYYKMENSDEGQV